MREIDFKVRTHRLLINMSHDFDEVCEAAVAESLSSHEPVTIEVAFRSRAAADIWGGDEAAKIYDENREAPVHERITITATSQRPVK